MLPILLDSSFNKLAYIDDYISFIWTTRYYEPGDFELCVSASAANFSLFQRDRMIYREDDENYGLIENIKIQRDDDGQEMIIVSGRFLASILGRRIIAEQTTLSGTIYSCIQTLLEENVISPDVAARTMSLTIEYTPTVGQDTMEAQYTGDNLLEVITDICRTNGIGFKVIHDQYNQYLFELYEGKNRTYQQSANDIVVFSDEYDNLLSSEYEENYEGIATSVLVAGEGEGLDRKTLWVTDGSTGKDRYETYLDQRQIQSNDGEITPTEYNKLLRQAGREAMTSYTKAFTGEVYFGNLTYKTDVNVGDICVIQNNNWGIYINSRLIEVIESVGETGEYSIIPTFGV